VREEGGGRRKERAKERKKPVAWTFGWQKDGWAVEGEERKDKGKK
jgi:hypothetical protein